MNDEQVFDIDHEQAKIEQDTAAMAQAMNAAIVKVCPDGVSLPALVGACAHLMGAYMAQTDDVDARHDMLRNMVLSLGLMLEREESFREARAAKEAANGG